MSLKIESIFNIPISIDNSNNILNILISFASSKFGQKIVFTPNPGFIIKAEREPEFKKILQSSDINLPDGIGIILASKILGGSIRERICGSDITIKLLENGNMKYVSNSEKLLLHQQIEFNNKVHIKNNIGFDRLELEERFTVGIIGARKGDLEEEEELILRLRAKYTKINFVNLDKLFLQHSISNTNEKSINNSSENSKIKNLVQNDNSYSIKNHGFNIVFACHGIGMQEKWIMGNKDKIKSGLFIGIGGSLDFITGFTKRAPLAIRKVWFEWFWRIIQKPSHIKRICRNVPVFFWFVLKEKFKHIP